MRHWLKRRVAGSLREMEAILPRFPADDLGALSFSARVAFLARAIGGRLALLTPSRAREALPASALRSLPNPGGALARHAEDISAELLPPWLAAHSSRTFAWAALLALRDGLAYDAELLYAACLLHDLGLCAPHAPPPGGCFALSGARAAKQRLRALGVEGEVVDRIASAIALHLEVEVALRHGVEAHLLHRGAALDVIGRDARALERALREDVVARWPRAACKAELRTAMLAEARRAPKSRMGLLVKLGFLGLISSAPFAE